MRLTSAGLARSGLFWQNWPGATGEHHTSRGAAKIRTAPKTELKLSRALTVFGVGAILTLIYGVLLEKVGDAAAKHLA